MQVWLFNPFDDIPSEGHPQRFWTLADALVAEGHEVVWWSSDFSHRRKAQRVAPSESEGVGVPPLGGHPDGLASPLSNSRRSKSLVRNHSATQPLNFSLRLISTPSYRKNISFARIWNHRVWGKQLFKDACQAIDSGELLKPNLILASLPPMEGPIAALRLRKRYGCRVVTDIMDAWPETLLQAVPATGGKLLKSLGRLALLSYYRMLRRACRESDAISAQSQTFADFARQHGARGEIHVCYLGANAVSAISNVERSKKAPLRVLYLGSMGRSYDLVTLLTATLNLLRQGLELELHIAGEGERFEALKGMAAKAPAGAIHFHGFLQEPELSELLRSSDVGLVPMFPESGVALPYKAGDYMSAGCAVINSLPGELDALLASNGCGRFYTAGSVPSLEAAMTFYCELPQAEFAAQEMKASALFDSHFDRAKTYSKFANWIASIHQ